MEVLRSNGKNLADDMIVDEAVSSSYTLVISPPSVDRSFFHHPGANDMFSATDIDRDIAQNAALFHFGYPPIMQQMYQNNGKQLTNIFREIKQSGVTTSLAMAFPDPDSNAGHPDWHTTLENTLPHVDIFLPSMDEIAFMLRHPWHKSPDELPISVGVLEQLANRLLDYGTGIVVLKLGDQGLYVHTPKYSDRLQHIPLFQQLDLDNWTDRELLAPCFKTEVAGTTGAGDSTIAGFLAGMLNGQSIEQCMKTAAGAGACNVEQPDATSGVSDWNIVQSRINSGWEILDTNVHLENWQWNEISGLYDRDAG
jgi:sugar/nucleoside kinase (ribokinase family)